MLGIKKLLFFVVIFCGSAVALATGLDDSCESAVDAADKLGSPISKECDYSNTGLNGVLHRAVAKKEKAVVGKSFSDDASASASSKNVEISTGSAVVNTANNSATNNVAESLLRVIFAEFETMQQLASARYELIREASQDCSNGFVLERESYFPTRNKLLKLQLTYSCF
ncbi:MAG: hypothetical protein V4660_10665 [Pseudomonadota bacterium]